MPLPLILTHAYMCPHATSTRSGPPTLLARLPPGSHGGGLLAVYWWSTCDTQRLVYALRTSSTLLLLLKPWFSGNFHFDITADGAPLRLDGHFRFFTPTSETLPPALSLCFCLVENMVVPLPHPRCRKPPRRPRPHCLPRIFRSSPLILVPTQHTFLLRTPR